MKINFPIKDKENSLNIEITDLELIFGVCFILIPGTKSSRFTQNYAINPISKKVIPIWETSEVTEIKLGIPAHDVFSYEFAKKYNLEIIQVVAKSFQGEGTSEIREDKPFTERVVVQIVVKHPTEEKYLVVINNKFGWVNFPMGGVEKDESVVFAALRELKEETGYYDITIEKELDLIYFDNFYAQHKEVNRHITCYTVQGRLNSLEQMDVTDEEKAIQSYKWVEEKDLIKTVSTKAHKYDATRVLRNEEVFLEDGVMINSDFLNNLDRETARNRVKKLLETNGDINV